MTIAGMDDELLQIAMSGIDDDPHSHYSVDEMRYGEDVEEAQSPPRPSRAKTVGLTELGCVVLAHCTLVQIKEHHRVVRVVRG